MEDRIKLYVQGGVLKYTLELELEKLQIYVKAFDGAIKLIAQALLQGNQGNSVLALKQLLPDLIKFNKELEYLDKLIDETDRQQKEGENKDGHL